MLLQDLANAVGRCLLSMDRKAVSTVSVAVTSWQELEYPVVSVAKTIKTACEQYPGNHALKVRCDFKFVVFLLFHFDFYHAIYLQLTSLCSTLVFVNE